jgi:hypothetical protein
MAGAGRSGRVCPDNQDVLVFILKEVLLKDERAVTGQFLNFVSRHFKVL